MTPDTIVNAPAPQNFFSRLIGVYFSPGDTFKDIGLAPNIVLPLIALILVSALVGIVMTQRLDTLKIASMGIEKAIADGKMTQEQAAPQLEMMKKNEGLIKASFPFFGVVGSLVLVFAIAGAFKLASVVLGTENKFMPILGVTIYATLAVAIVSSLAFVAILFLKSPDEIDIQNPIGSNLGSLLTLFLGKDSIPQFILTLANWIDIFSIWRLSLLAIGYAAVSRKLKTASAFTTLLVMYAGAALIAATWSAIFG